LQAFEKKLLPLAFASKIQIPQNPVRDQGIGGSNPLSPTNQNQAKINDS